MSNELAIIGQNAPVGNFNFKSRFSRVKPGTLTIVQPTSLNGTKGNLRIAETGQEFKSMRVAFLSEPKEQRQFHIGEGEMNRIPENLMCFTRNVVREENYPFTELQGPDLKAKVPQAQRCFGCPNADWTNYNQTQDKDDIPPCDLYIYATLIDTEFKLPLQLYIRSKSKQPFEKAMENITRKLIAKNAKDGLPPNYFDVSFTLGTKAIQNKRKQTSYILDFSNFEVVTDEEREAFGEVFKNLVGYVEVEEPASTQIAKTQESVDALVTDAEYDDSEPITI